jgi:hypothetical protein
MKRCEIGGWILVAAALAGRYNGRRPDSRVRDCAKREFADGRLPADIRARRGSEAAAALTALESLARLDASTVSNPDKSADPRLVIALAEAYADGMIAASAQTPPKLTDDELKKKYSGGRPRGQAWQYNATQFELFLLDWQPLGKTVDKLERLTGLKGRVVEGGGRVDFTFEIGFVGVTFLVHVREGVIIGIGAL